MHNISKCVYCLYDRRMVVNLFNVLIRARLRTEIIWKETYVYGSPRRRCQNTGELFAYNFRCIITLRIILSIRNSLFLCLYLL